MKKFFNISILVCLLVALQSCFGPNYRKYSFPQVELYVTITYDDSYGYAILSRDSCVTTLSSDADYVRIRPFESSYIGLLINPESPDTVYVFKGWEEPFISQKSFSIININPKDTSYFQEKIVSGGVRALFSRPEFFEISISDGMGSVGYFETGENKSYIIAEPCK